MAAEIIVLCQHRDSLVGMLPALRAMAAGQGSASEFAPAPLVSASAPFVPPSAQDMERLVGRFPVLGEDRAPVIETSAAPPLVSEEDWRAHLRYRIRWFDMAKEPVRELGGLRSFLGQDMDSGMFAAFPEEIQQAYLQYSLARARSLVQVGSIAWSDTGPIAKRIRTCADTLEVGPIHGLRADAEPKSGTWAEDADTHLAVLRRAANGQIEKPVPAGVAVGEVPNPERLLAALEETILDAATYEEIRDRIIQALDGGVSSADQRLVRLTRPFEQQMRATPRFRKLRSAIRDRTVAADDTASESVPELLVPDDWPWMSLTRDRAGVLVGGVAVEPCRVRIQEAFRFRELPWQEADRHLKGLGDLAQRIRAGRYHVVILLVGFLSHPVSDSVTAACRDAGIPYVFVTHGYGVAKIRQSVESQIRR